jgi:hypothetical protein
LDGAGHWRGFKESPVVHQSRVAGALEFVHQALLQGGACLRILRIGGDVFRLIRISLEVVKLLARALAIDPLEMRFPLRVVPHAHEPGLRRAGVFIGERDARVLGEFLDAGRVRSFGLKKPSKIIL